jgi:catechol 2,3-dioxygenase-like lactoylglutathione lyase family enzyme
MRLELVPVPVSDIDRAKAFYVDQVGFTLDHDVTPADGVRVVQLTPPGSACSIVLGEGLPGIAMEPGILRGLHLVVPDMAAARESLLSRGLETTPVSDMGGILFSGFEDPDGNTWVLQQIESP